MREAVRTLYPVPLHVMILIRCFRAKISGNNACAGHSECDAIIMDNAKVRAIPELEANNLDAELIHEAQSVRLQGNSLLNL